MAQALHNTLSRALLAPVEWAIGCPPVGRSLWPVEVAIAAGVRPGGCALFIQDETETTCSLVLTSPLISRASSSCSVSCSSDVRINCVPLVWLPQSRAADVVPPAVLCLPALAVAPAVSIVLIDLGIDNAATESALHVSSISRLLLQSVVAIDAVVSLSCCGGRRVQYRVSRWVLGHRQISHFPP